MSVHLSELKPFHSTEKGRDFLTTCYEKPTTPFDWDQMDRAVQDIFHKTANSLYNSFQITLKTQPNEYNTLPTFSFLVKPRHLDLSIQLIFFQTFFPILHYFHSLDNDSPTPAEKTESKSDDEKVETKKSGKSFSYYKIWQLLQSPTTTKTDLLLHLKANFERTHIENAFRLISYRLSRQDLITLTDASIEKDITQFTLAVLRVRKKTFNKSTLRQFFIQAARQERIEVLQRILDLRLRSFRPKWKKDAIRLAVKEGRVEVLRFFYEREKRLITEDIAFYFQEAIRRDQIGVCRFFLGGNRFNHLITATLYSDSFLIAVNMGQLKIAQLLLDIERVNSKKERWEQKPYIISLDILSQVLTILENTILSESTDKNTRENATRLLRDIFSSKSSILGKDTVNSLLDRLKEKGFSILQEEFQVLWEKANR